MGHLRLHRAVSAVLVLVLLVVAGCGGGSSAGRSALTRFRQVAAEIAENTGYAADDVEQSLLQQLRLSADEVTDIHVQRARTVASETDWIDDAARATRPGAQEVAQRTIASTVCDVVQYRLEYGQWPPQEDVVVALAANAAREGLALDAQSEAAAAASVFEELNSLYELTADDADLLRWMVAGTCIVT